MNQHEKFNEKVMDSMLPNDGVSNERPNTAKRNAILLSTIESLMIDMGFKDGGANDVIYYKKMLNKVGSNYQSKHSQANVTEAKHIQSNAEINRNEKMQNQIIKELTERCEKLQFELENQRKTAQNIESLESALQVANAKYEQLQFDHQKEMQLTTETHSQSMQKLALEVLRNSNSREKANNDRHLIDNQNITLKHEQSVQTTPQLDESTALKGEIDQLKQRLAELHKKHKSIIEEAHKLHRNDIDRHHEIWQKSHQLQLLEQEKTFDNKMREVNQQRDTEIQQIQLKLQKNIDNSKASDERIQTLNQTIKELEENFTREKAQLISERTLYTKKIGLMQREYIQQLERIVTDMSKKDFAKME